MTGGEVPPHDEQPIGEGESARLTELLPRLAIEARTLVAAEIEVYRAEFDWRLRAAGWAALAFAGAIGVATAALITLLVGLLAWIGAMVGLGLAILIVVGVGVGIAALLAWLGLRQIKNIRSGGQVLKP